MKYLRKYKILFILVTFILIIIYTLLNRKYIVKKENLNDFENEITYVEEIPNLEKDKEEIEEKKVLYKVDVKGAVKKPGVYEIEDNMRVIDAINKAGGLLNYSNTSTINLSKFVTDEMVITVYTNDEIQKLKEDNTIIKYVEKECECPKLENDACIIDEIDTNKNSLVNINTATIEQLMTIPKIGESKAEDIIKYREENGEFKSIEEIKNISGIKDATYDAIKEYITI